MACVYPVVCVIGINQDPLSLVDRISNGQSTLSGNQTVWNISTKYYTATIAIQPITYTGNENLQAIIAQETEGIFFYFDVNDSTSFELVRTVESQLQLECELKIAVICGDKLADHDSKIRDIIEWSAHNSRFVEVVDLNASADPESDEKEGIDRVVEAIHNTQWSSMICKSQTNGNSEMKSLEDMDKETMSLFDMLLQWKVTNQNASRNDRLRTAEDVVRKLCENFSDVESDFSADDDESVI